MFRRSPARRRCSARSPGTASICLLYRGVFGGVAVLLYFLAIEHMPVGMATLLNYSSPIWSVTLRRADARRAGAAAAAGAVRARARRHGARHRCVRAGRRLCRALGRLGGRRARSRRCSRRRGGGDPRRAAQRGIVGDLLQLHVFGLLVAAPFAARRLPLADAGGVGVARPGGRDLDLRAARDDATPTGG